MIQLQVEKKKRKSVQKNAKEIAHVARSTVVTKYSRHYDKLVIEKRPTGRELEKCLKRWWYP